MAYSHVPFGSVGVVTTLSLQEGGFHNSHKFVGVTPPLSKKVRGDPISLQAYADVTSWP